MELVGIDPSLTSTGVAYQGKTVAIKPKTRSYKRVMEIRDTIQEILDSLTDPVVLIEGYAYAKAGMHTYSMGELGGVVRVNFIERGIPYIEVSPAARAKFATGKGNASKAEVVSHVSARTGRLWTGNSATDECDAWIIREMGLAKLGASEWSWPEANMQSLVKIDWTPMERYNERKSNNSGTN